VTLSTGLTSNWTLPYTFLASCTLSTLGLTTANGMSYYLLPLGTTSAGYTAMMTNAGVLPDGTVNDYFPLGFTLPQGISGFLTSEIVETQITSYFPSMLEVYQNRLFLAGFSLTPSTVWFSDVAEPEGYQPDWNFEVRTNDADVITCIKSYLTRMFLFKRNSFHVLTGDNPENFFLQEVSAEYGCLNNRCCVTFGNEMVFLDRKGIILFNGAQLSVLSIKVQPYFDRMNYTAALSQACMMHDKLRNQILIAIPIDGSSTNNLTLVFDYVTQGWTTHAGYSPTVFTMAQGYNVTKYPMYGDNQGRVNWFGPSFLSDNHTGFTLSFKTRFIHDVSDSIQKQFRRLYISANPLSATLTCPINFYQDYGSSIVKSTTMGIGPFQQRIDFGISAKALAFDFAAVSNVAPLQIDGFTIEQRMQRKV